MYWLKVAIIGIALGFGLQFVRAWTEPTTAPPNGNVGAPINTSSTAQTKAGAMYSNDRVGAPYLCIGTDCRNIWSSGGISCDWDGEFKLVCGGRTFGFSTVYVCSNGILTRIYFIFEHC